MPSYVTRPAGFVVMSPSERPEWPHYPVAFRATLDEALAKLCEFTKQRIDSGFPVRVGLYVVPTDEVVDVEVPE